MENVSRNKFIDDEALDFNVVSPEFEARRLALLYHLANRHITKQNTKIEKLKTELENSRGQHALLLRAYTDLETKLTRLEVKLRKCQRIHQNGKKKKKKVIPKRSAHFDDDDYDDGVLASSSLLADVEPSFKDLSEKMHRMTQEVERTMSTVLDKCRGRRNRDRENYELVRKTFLKQIEEDEMMIPVEEDSIFFKGPDKWYEKHQQREHNMTVDKMFASPTRKKALLSCNESGVRISKSIIPPASRHALENISIGGEFFDFMVS